MALNRFLPERHYVAFGSLLSQIRLSVCRLYRVCTLLRGVETFGNISSPFRPLAIL